jgi:hypothetical protein
MILVASFLLAVDDIRPASRGLGGYEEDGGRAGDRRAGRQGTEHDEDMALQLAPEEPEAGPWRAVPLPVLVRAVTRRRPGSMGCGLRLGRPADRRDPGAPAPGGGSQLPAAALG